MGHVRPSYRRIQEEKTSKSGRKTCAVLLKTKVFPFKCFVVYGIINTMNITTNQIQHPIHTRTDRQTYTLTGESPDKSSH